MRRKVVDLDCTSPASTVHNRSGGRPPPASSVGPLLRLASLPSRKVAPPDLKPTSAFPKGLAGGVGAPGSHGDGRERRGAVFSRTARGVLRVTWGTLQGREEGVRAPRRVSSGLSGTEAVLRPPRGPGNPQPEPGRSTHPDDSRAGNPFPATDSPPPMAQGLSHQRRNCVCWGNAQVRK